MQVAFRQKDFFCLYFLFVCWLLLLSAIFRKKCTIFAPLMLLNSTHFLDIIVPYFAEFSNFGIIFGAILGYSVLNFIRSQFVFEE